MFACFSNAGGEADRLLAALAATLLAEGRRVVGVVQIERDRGTRTGMGVRLLDSGTIIEISQPLGAGAAGCRLDPGALERAVAMAANGLAAGADLLIVNRFGQQEAGGRGFRTLIGQALGEGVPVLTALGESYREAFEAFAEGAAEELEPAPEALLDWCRRALPARV